MPEDLFSLCDNSGGRQSRASVAPQGRFRNPGSFYSSIPPSFMAGLLLQRGQGEELEWVLCQPWADSAKSTLLAIQRAGPMS